MNIKNYAQPVLTAVLAAALVMLGLNLYVVPQITELQAEGRGGVNTFTSPVVFRDNVAASQAVTVSGAVTAGSLTTAGALSGATLAVSGASTLTGATTFAANPLLPTESITPTNNGTITPTMSLVTLTPGGAVTVTLGACTAGQRSVLYNSINANVIISDTGNFVGAGNQTIGQYDTLPLACFGSVWVQTGPVSSN